MEFVEGMLRVTERGLVGGFEGEYRHLASEAVVRVVLGVNMVAKAA